VLKISYFLKQVFEYFSCTQKCIQKESQNLLTEHWGGTVAPQGFVSKSWGSNGSQKWYHRFVDENQILVEFWCGVIYDFPENGFVIHAILI